MDDLVRVLMIEDNGADAELAIRHLREQYPDLVAQVVASEPELRDELVQFSPNLIISDFSMPGFTGLEALDVVREIDNLIPFIFLSGTIGEERAIEAIKRGATDYVLKDNMRRLGTATRRAVEEAEERRARQQAELQLGELRERLQSILSSLQDVIWSVSMPDAVLVFINQAAHAVFGRSPEDFLADRALWFASIHPEDRTAVGDIWDRIVELGEYSIEYRILKPDGSLAWVHDRARATYDRDGSLVRIDGITSDITERKNQELHILRLSRIHRSVSAVNSAIVRASTPENLVSECCRILVQEGGFRLAYIGDLSDTGAVIPRAAAGPAADYMETRFAVDGSQIDEHSLMVAAELRERGSYICDEIDTDDMMPSRRQALARELHSFAVLRLPSQTGHAVVMGLYAGEVGYFDAQEMELLADLASDIGNALDQAEQAAELDYLATYDRLTGLLNKDGLSARLRATLDALSDNEGLLAWIEIDILRFSQINESLGRDVGDALLQQVARRLQTELTQKHCLLARLDADHFAVVPPVFLRASDIGKFIEGAVLPLFSQPFIYDDRELYLMVKAGVALAPNDGTDPDALLINAATAVRRAGAASMQYVFYAADMNTRVSDRLAMENRLQTALELEQFVLHYQPKIDVETGRIVGAEALIRWDDPDVGLVPPFKFIPLLEETGLIIEVGSWVIRQAFDDLLMLRPLGNDFGVAVNVSSLQMRRQDFVRDLAAYASSNSVVFSAMGLEITESMLMDEAPDTIATLEAIREMGVKISIDDFGTGYSSLSMISKLPIDILKVDRSFVVNMTKTARDLAMVSTIIDLAHALDLRVVAEGVDDRAQLELLRQVGCDEIQGFLYSRPVPLEDFRTLLIKQREGHLIIPG